MKKRYLKSRPVCQVTFRLPKDAVVNAESACIVGEFNGWDESRHPMKKLKSGEFKLMLELDFPNQYQFRYLIDCERWENDWGADAYVASSVGPEENSVVVV